MSLNSDKPMDIFPGWEEYVKKIEKNFFSILKEQDTLIVAGDFSWGMTLEESLKDFKFLDSFPGRKILLKGNHDFYWETYTKMNNFFKFNNINSISILHNNAYEVEDFAICGTRGWVKETDLEVNDEKILRREAGRLEISILKAKKINKPIKVFLHYPPVYKNTISENILNILYKYDVKECYYGHIHGAGKAHAVQGDYNGIKLKLISADYLKFMPVKIR